jgi:alpha-N-arabinofuranosidase
MVAVGEYYVSIGGNLRDRNKWHLVKQLSPPQLRLPTMRKLFCVLFALLNFNVRAAPAPVNIAIELDLKSEGAPINPFIYGQFIEHLGRCIYGGIWAEMLEDRKFYFPITGDYAPYARLTETDYPVVGASPWEILGKTSGVRMTTEAPFVGKHSPIIETGSGIRQNDLGVRENVLVQGYVWAKSIGETAKLRLTFTSSPTDFDSLEIIVPAGDFTQQSFEFHPSTTVARGATFSIEVLQGTVVLGPPSLMPADNLNGLRADTLALLKDLNGTIYRWPGGNFVSGYNWRDGIGDRDRRPPRKNPAWTGVEHNDFGTDEFIAFCREINTTPMIAANTGLGDAYSAAQWVEYTNGAATTIGGGWRVANGHAKPYNVNYWCVGNEMFGRWQLGYMALSHYIIKHNEVSEAMWAIDPDLTLVGVGDLTTINEEENVASPLHQSGWSEGMLRHSADHMTMLSEHFYAGRTPWTSTPRPSLFEHVTLLKTAIRAKADGHRELQARLPNLNGRVVPIAMDEWNYWHRDYVYGELGSVYDLSDTLGTAMGLHEYFRQSDLITMAHYAQTVNVIGAIKTSRISAEMEGTGLVLQLYRGHYGTIPLAMPATTEPYDIAAALTSDRTAVTISVVNPTSEAVHLSLKLPSAQGKATRWHITGKDEFAHNHPGDPRDIDILQTDNVDATKPLIAPALSATLFRIELKP